MRRLLHTNNLSVKKIIVSQQKNYFISQISKKGRPGISPSSSLSPEMFSFFSSLTLSLFWSGSTVFTSSALSLFSSFIVSSFGVSGFSSLFSSLASSFSCCTTSSPFLSDSSALISSFFSVSPKTCSWLFSGFVSSSLFSSGFPSCSIRSG